MQKYKFFDYIIMDPLADWHKISFVLGPRIFFFLPYSLHVIILQQRCSFIIFWTKFCTFRFYIIWGWLSLVRPVTNCKAGLTHHKIILEFQSFRPCNWSLASVHWSRGLTIYVSLPAWPCKVDTFPALTQNSILFLNTLKLKFINSLFVIHQFLCFPLNKYFTQFRWLFENYLAQKHISLSD